MKQYMTELHAHSCEVSPCADLTVEEVAERYIAAGYTTLVLTNHYCDYVMDNAGRSWEDRITHYLSAYRKMRAYAEGRLHVLLGCELRFEGSENDYLILGLTEDFLIDHPELHKRSLKGFSRLARDHGLLVIWAHPFRNRMTVVDPSLLDGIETFNAHPGHDSRNPLADAFARRYHLLRTSGSDFHHLHSVEAGGILTQTPITSMEELVRVIKEGDCDLICRGPVARAEGISDMPAKYE